MQNLFVLLQPCQDASRAFRVPSIDVGWRMAGPFEIDGAKKYGDDIWWGNY
jgi:hypothetical protein